MDAGKRMRLSVAERRSGRRCMASIGLWAAFWALGLGLLASPGMSQERRPHKAVAGRPAAVMAEKQFTIAKIEPYANKEEVQILFQQARAPGRLEGQSAPPAPGED